MDRPGSPTHDDEATPPAVPGASPPAVYDEEAPDHVPGSFLSALPQFFVFPLILVGTLTAIYLGLRWISGTEPASAAELLSDLRAAGAHSRWQVAQQLADGLQRGRLTLDEVPADELSSLWTTMAGPGLDEGAREPGEVEQLSLMRQYLLSVLAFKDDPALTGHALAALAGDDGAVRMAALVALGRMADPAGAPALVAHLSHEVPEERWLAIGALAQVGTPDALDALAGLLGGDDTLDHRNAVLALAARGDGRAAPYLGPMLQRTSYERDPALDAPDADLLDEASRAARRSHTVDLFLVNAARASARLGDLAAVPYLERLRRDDPSVKVQSAAINALHDLGAERETSDGDV